MGREEAGMETGAVLEASGGQHRDLARTATGCREQ